MAHTRTEACEALGISRQALRDWTRAGAPGPTATARRRCADGRVRTLDAYTDAELGAVRRWKRDRARAEIRTADTAEYHPRKVASRARRVQGRTTRAVLFRCPQHATSWQAFHPRHVPQMSNAITCRHVRGNTNTLCGRRMLAMEWDDQGQPVVYRPRPPVRPDAFGSRLTTVAALR